MNVTLVHRLYDDRGSILRQYRRDLGTMSPACVIGMCYFGNGTSGDLEFVVSELVYDLSSDTMYAYSHKQFVRSLGEVNDADRHYIGCGFTVYDAGKKKNALTEAESKAASNFVPADELYTKEK